MGLREADKLAIAEDEGVGPIQEMLAGTARELGLWLVAGTVPLRLPGDAARTAAACLVFDADGRRVARYDKIHLFDVAIPGRDERYEESASVRPGTTPVCVDTPAGRLGLAVCYDLRFPELFRRLLDLGAEWFCLPSAFTAPTGRAHWEALLRARAIENLCHVVAPAQSGFHENGRETHGDSMILDCWGRVLARLPRGTGVVVGDIDLVRQREVRQNFPSVDHRRLIP
jgi:nitrilase